MSTKNNNEKIESKEEIIEIVERIQNPEKKDVQEDGFVSFYQDYKNTTQHPEKKKSKKIFQIVAGFTSLCLLAYVGSRYVQEDTTKPLENLINIVENDTKMTKEEEKQKVVSLDKSLKLEQELQALENISQNEEKDSLLISENVTPIGDKEDIKTQIVQKVLTQLEAKEKNKVITAQKSPIIFEKEREALPVIMVQQEPMVVKQKNRQIAYKTIHYKKIEPRKLIIREGDTLVSIAQKFYGNGMDFKRIIRANYTIKSAKTPLHLGQKIIIPRKDGKKRRRFVVVEQGDNLAYISKSVYGTTEKVPTIIRANYKIKSKSSVLHLGQEVYVPRLEFK